LTPPENESSLGEEKEKVRVASIPAFVEKTASAGFARGLRGLRSRIAVQFQPTGIPELDEMLGGGFPQGSLVELCGPSSSGRTSLAFSLLAKATEQQQTCAFVDVSDSLDPLSLAAAGVELPRVLWIRCGESENDPSVVPSSSVFAKAHEKVQVKGPAHNTERSTRATRESHGSWQHPRQEVRGIDEAIPILMRAKPTEHKTKEISVVASCAGEQVERDRQLPRRGIRPLPQLKTIPERDTPRNIPGNARRGKPWKRMEQGLRATELLLQSSGWSVIVLDLGGISWVEARKINLSLWFRFRRAVEGTSTILLLLGEDSYAKTCASLILRCGHKDKIWKQSFANATCGVSTFEGFDVQTEVIRSRVQSPPGGFACWRAHAL
jgi:recombination protein RecA